MVHTVHRGDTVDFAVQVRDRRRGVVDISGWTLVLSAARKKGGTVAFSVNGTIVDAANGEATFELTPTHTANVGRFFYDVQATAPGSKVYTVDDGEIEIVQDVTP